MEKCSFDYFDIASKSATVFIALFNLVFAIIIFTRNWKKNNEDKKKDRNIQALKVLILDHNLKYFYSFFDEAEPIFAELKANGLSDEVKGEIVDRISDKFILVRRKFTDTLMAIDKNLYDNVLSLFDDFESELNNIAFDADTSLSDQNKFDELITAKSLQLKTNSLKLLFKFNV